MCLVEIDKISKPVTACSASFLANSVIYTNTPLLKKARENIIEALLLNHPLDCPICDQAGECDLQEQVTQFGSSQSRFYIQKKQATANKNCGPLVKTIMTRCIHCTRCIRFSTEVAGVEILGTLNRGGSTEIGTYVNSLFHSEISGNVIDLCPVGALTANFYSFELRPWELYTIETIDLSDSIGSNIYIHFNGFEQKPVENLIKVKSPYSFTRDINSEARSVIRILPKINEDINGNWISDRARFSFDSLKNNRLYKETYFSCYDQTSLLSRFKLQEDSISYPKPADNFLISFLINESVDLEVLTVLNKLKQKYSTISLFSTDKPTNSTNYYSLGNFDKISSLNLDINYCFLFASNIKTESILLSTKLKSKCLNQNIEFISLGLFSNRIPLPINFINLTLQNIVSFIEGKDSNYCRFIISNQLSLFCFGESFINRSNSSYRLILNQLKLISPTAIFQQLNKKSNTSSFNLLSIRRVNSRFISSPSSKFLYNLDVSLNVNKILTKLYFNRILIKEISSVYWFNSHNPAENIFFHDINLIPLLTVMESEGIHLNLEERPQRNSQLSTFFVTSLKNSFFSNIYLKNLKKENFFSIKQSFFMIPSNLKNILKIDEIPEFFFIYELVNNYKLFDGPRKIFSNLINLMPLTSFGLSFKYTFKSNLIDIYTMNSYLKNSSRMAECSRELRKISNNFF